MISKSQLEVSFKKLGQELSILSNEFRDNFNDLNKNEIRRVALAVIEYPNKAKVQTQREYDLVQIGVKMKELQFSLTSIHAALDELDQEEIDTVINQEVVSE